LYIAQICACLLAHVGVTRPYWCSSPTCTPNVFPSSLYHFSFRIFFHLLTSFSVFVGEEQQQGKSPNLVGVMQLTNPRSKNKTTYWHRPAIAVESPPRGGGVGRGLGTDSAVPPRLEWQAAPSLLPSLKLRQ
jgi:hypothetical protein